MLFIQRSPLFGFVNCTTAFLILTSKDLNWMMLVPIIFHTTRCMSCLVVLKVSITPSVAGWCFFTCLSFCICHSALIFLRLHILLFYFEIWSFKIIILILNNITTKTKNVSSYVRIVSSSYCP